MRGHHDAGFNRRVAWDTPLLHGYPHRVLHNQRGAPLQGFRSLTGRGLFRLLRRERPQAVILAPFLYEFDTTAYAACFLLGIPIWVKHETQDEAFPRSAAKSALRSLFYRAAYRLVRHAFYIGELNREHLLRHGVPADRLSFAPLGSPIEFENAPAQKQRTRDTVRAQLGVGPDDHLVLFSGKLIEKKNPGLILAALAQLPPETRGRFHVVYVGSGPLEATLRAAAAEFPGRIHFTGFVNQTEIPGYYLAADTLVLPSNRAGETWGLVVNEALQAGCGVIMTSAVGSHRNFGAWERARVIPENDAAACARSLVELDLPRSFEWCADRIAVYSIDAAAQAIAREIDTLSTRGAR